MKTSDFDYDLPPELIAQTPLEPRDAARLLVMPRAGGDLTHAHFHQVGNWLRPGDLLVANQTRVIPARVYARKLPGGGRLELLLLRRRDYLTWEALVGGKGMRPGRQLQIEAGPAGEIVEDLGGPRRLVRFDQPIEAVLEQVGQMPLPPYIHTPLERPERYQTVYAQDPGSAAAPTAGLHFTPALIEQLQAAGIGFANVTLHVGLDTFAPVTEDDPRTHLIHTEWCQVSPQAAERINQAQRAGGRIIAVGTTSVRTLESAARHAAPGDLVAAYAGPTALFILPGYQFRAIDGLITNFHLPKSTLIMMISAFAGRAAVLHAYQVARQERYRFYSFGDAMLII